MLTEEPKKLVGISSPPYERQLHDLEEFIPPHDSSKNLSKKIHKYGSSQGQIGMLESKQNQEVDFDMESLCSCSEIYWFNCYESDSRYKQFITPESFAHPAKASFGLIERIYKHLELLGLLKKDDKIIDFMAGTSRIPLLAALKGYSTISVELEDHFVKMSEGNKAHAERFTGKKLDMQILKGDARKLSELLKEGGVGISSPPYNKEEHSRFKKNPLMMQTLGERHGAYGAEEYSSDPNNIGNLKDEPQKVSITSPPYHNIEIGKGLNTKPPREGKNDQAGRDPKAASQTETRYSSSEANIGNLEDKEEE